MDASDNNSRQLSTSNAQEREDNCAQTNIDEEKLREDIEVFKHGLTFIENEYENKIGALWVYENCEILKDEFGLNWAKLLENFNQEQKDKINFANDYCCRENASREELEQNNEEFENVVTQKISKDLETEVKEDNSASQYESALLHK